MTGADGRGLLLVLAPGDTTFWSEFIWHSNIRGDWRTDTEGRITWRELVPGVDDRAWRQVSVNARECIGAQKCPFGSQCFAEQARDAAGEADIVVQNVDATVGFDDVGGELGDRP